MEQVDRAVHARRRSSRDGPGLAALLALVAAALPVACSGPAAGTPAASPTAGQPEATGMAAVDAATVAVVKAVGPSVVLIETPEGLGSGEVYDAKGDVVTNAHVVGGATAFVVTTAAGKRLAGTLVGSFPPDDIAVIRVPGAGLRPARFGDSSRLQVGELALAIGNPLGLESSVTSGIVSALGRVVSEGAGGGTLPDAIQTSAPINPGNSGGALVDMASEVIGIPTLAALSPGSGAPAPGIGFAISSNRARSIADQLVQYGRVVDSGRAYLGVQAGGTSDGQGVVVLSVVPGGPAARAGMAPGSLITSVAGTPTPGPSQLAETLARLRPGQTVPVGTVLPGGGRTELPVTLGELPG